MTALAAIAYFKASSHSTVAKLARELALEVADGTFAPEFNQHVPGAANIIADTLSRRLQPGKTFVLPLNTCGDCTNKAAQAHQTILRGSLSRGVGMAIEGTRGPQKTEY